MRLRDVLYNQCFGQLNENIFFSVSNNLGFIRVPQAKSSEILVRYARKIESTLDVQWTGKSQPEGSMFQRVQCSSGKLGVGPEGSDFPVDTEHQWSIILLTDHILFYSILSYNFTFGDVL